MNSLSSSLPLSCRAKYHKLKYGTDLNQGDVKPPSYDAGKFTQTLPCQAAILGSPLSYEQASSAGTPLGVGGLLLWLLEFEWKAGGRG